MFIIGRFLPIALWHTNCCDHINSRFVNYYFQAA